MDKSKIFIIVLSLIIGAVLVGMTIWSIIDLTRAPSPTTTTIVVPPENSVPSRPVQTVSTPSASIPSGGTPSVTAPPTPAPSQIPRKVYAVYDDNGTKYARSINFENKTLQGMNVVDVAGIIEPMNGKEGGSYGLAVLHSDRNGQNRMAVISNYNTDSAEYRHFDSVDSKGSPVRGMNRLTNTNTIMFGLANGKVYYFNPVQDHWVATPLTGIQNISGTSVSTNLLANDMLYNVKVEGGTITLTNPVKVNIPRGFYRIYGPTPQTYADINPSTGDALVTLPNGTTTLSNVADINFVFDGKNVSTAVVYRDDKNFVRSKHLLGDQLLVGRNMNRTKDMDGSDITVKL